MWEVNTTISDYMQLKVVRMRKLFAAITSHIKGSILGKVRIQQSGSWCHIQ